MSQPFIEILKYPPSTEKLEILFNDDKDNKETNNAALVVNLLANDFKICKFIEFKYKNVSSKILWSFFTI